MSYPRSKPIPFGETFIHDNESLAFLWGVTSRANDTDGAIDDALRNVPLPEGLLKRLGRLAYSVSDETADRVDYLGC